MPRITLGRGMESGVMLLSASRSMMTAASCSSAASAPGYPMRTALGTVEPSMTMMRVTLSWPRGGASACGGSAASSGPPCRIMPWNSLTLSLSTSRHRESLLAYSLR